MNAIRCSLGNLSDEYPEISKRAIRVLLQFATIDLCESGFSGYAIAPKIKIEENWMSHRMGELNYPALSHLF